MHCIKKYFLQDYTSMDTDAFYYYYSAFIPDFKSINYHRLEKLSVGDYKNVKKNAYRCSLSRGNKSCYY